MDYRGLKEKKVYLVIPVSKSDQNDATTNKAYVVADNVAEAIAKVRVVDKSLLEGDSIQIGYEPSIKDLEESISDKKQTKEIKTTINGKEVTDTVEVKDGDPDYKHHYVSGKIYAKTMTDGNVILFLADNVDDVINHISDPNIAEVSLYDEKAYLIDHLDKSAIEAANNPSSATPGEGDGSDAGTSTDGNAESN